MKRAILLSLMVCVGLLLNSCKQAEQTEPGPGQKTVVFSMQGGAGEKVQVRLARVTNPMQAGVASGQSFEMPLPMEKKMFLGPSEYEFMVTPLHRDSFKVTADGKDVGLTVAGNSVMFEIK